jgi:hypothetical protein
MLKIRQMCVFTERSRTSEIARLTSSYQVDQLKADGKVPDGKVFAEVHGKVPHPTPHTPTH